MYSIRHINIQFRHLAPPGFEKEVLRKLVLLIPKLESCDLILGWVNFIGGLWGVPADLRPGIRRCIAEARDSPSPSSDWENRLKLVFEETGESEHDNQAIRDILRYLSARFREGHASGNHSHANTEATHLLITYATTSSYVSPSDVCLLIHEIGGMRYVPHKTRTSLQKYLTREVLNFPHRAFNWRHGAGLIFEAKGSLGYVDDQYQIKILNELPPKFDTIEDVVALVNIAGSMSEIPDVIRPKIRRCVLTKPTENLPWEIRAVLVLESLTNHDVEDFGQLLQHLLDSLKQHWVLETRSTGHAHLRPETTAAQVTAKRDMFFERTRKINAFLADNSTMFTHLHFDLSGALHGYPVAHHLTDLSLDARCAVFDNVLATIREQG
ncbi:hypothetical protein K474DRAFT_461744 [Panus rudis PR-1116 ss-1]|nr:hypothetical protein K474DRAFT_461744 [Panus rudis PR-1116 ss-1]